MIRLVQNNLIIPRGDTGTFSIPVLSSLGEAVGVFTVLDPRTNTKVFEKQVSPSGETLTVVFSHGDTVNLPVGKFLWDVKFYLNPVFADGKLIDGVEVNSYYAAYKLPYCEIRQTGDNLLTSDESPSTTITPESLNVLEAIANEVVTAKNEATQAAESASASASAAEEYAEQITGLSATAETLPSEQPATASYDAETGVLTIGVPKGEAFQIAKEYSSVAAMNADYNNSNIRIGDFVVISSTVEDPDNAKIYVKGEEAYVFVVDMSGPAGDEYTVMVQDTQPTQETNKLWIPISQGIVQEVPTVQEMNAAIAAIDVPVEDVQVNGASVVNNGIAEIPIASTTEPGIAVFNPVNGVTVENGGVVLISPATDNAVKIGTNIRKPLVPANEHTATFYGLARAAGDTTQSQSSNSVGSYTDEAKAAINNMLGSATKEELAALDYAPAILVATSNNTFTDGVEGRPVACTIELKPTQAGSGTPSASNIRTIKGYQEAYLWRGNGDNHTALSTDPFTGSIGATAAKFVALSPFQPLEAYRISRAELVADKHYRLEFDLEISGTSETNRPSVYIGNTMPTSGTSGIATKVNENNGHYTIDFNTNAQQLYSGNVFSFSPLSFRNDVQNVQFTISNLSLIETDSWYLSIPEEAQDVYGESMSMDENFHLITVENKAFFGGVFTIDTDGNTVLTKTHKCIRSYNGETLPGAWISDRDEYAPGTTPTTGALVVYELAEADRETFTIQKHYITSLAGVNVFTSDVGTVSIDGYTADTKMYIDNAAAGGVQDVQINGTSVVNGEGVANIPKATAGILGAVLIASNTEVASSSGGNVLIGAQTKRIAFYGLAKAAGDTTQSQSGNPVGTYTDEAKTAIQSMLGIAQVATAEEVAEIITSYEEDEDMIFEMTIVNKGHGEFEYKSVDPTETILDAYTSGKHVILHFPYSESLTLPNCYASILSYNEEEERLTFGGLNIGEFLLTELSIDGDEYITISP